MKNVALIQARMGSTRLPGKMLMDLQGKTLLEWVIQGVQKSNLLDEIVLCTSNKSENDALVENALSLGIRAFRGSEDNVLERFVEAASEFHADNIVRVCADNPFVNGKEIDHLISFFCSGDYDYSFNHIPKLNNGYPDGFGAEIVKFEVLRDIYLQSDLSDAEKEHVTMYIWNRNKHKIGILRARDEIVFPQVRLDIDTIDDFRKLDNFIYELIDKNIDIYNIREVCTHYNTFFKD